MSHPFNIDGLADVLRETERIIIVTLNATANERVQRLSILDGDGIALPLGYDGFEMRVDPLIDNGRNDV